jgi:hypothetical protein
MFFEYFETNFETKKKENLDFSILQLEKKKKKKFSSAKSKKKKKKKKKSTLYFL